MHAMLPRQSVVVVVLDSHVQATFPIQSVKEVVLERQVQELVMSQV